MQVAPMDNYACGSPFEPDTSYWFFANLQATVQQAMLSDDKCRRHADSNGGTVACKPVLVGYARVI
jgi:hypothetical protein